MKLRSTSPGYFFFFINKFVSIRLLECSNSVVRPIAPKIEAAALPERWTDYHDPSTNPFSLMRVDKRVYNFCACYLAWEWVWLVLYMRKGVSFCPLRLCKICSWRWDYSLYDRWKCYVLPQVRFLWPETLFYRRFWYWWR